MYFLFIFNILSYKHFYIKKTMCHSTLKGGVCNRHLFLGCQVKLSEVLLALKIPLKEFSCAQKLKSVKFTTPL